MRIPTAETEVGTVTKHMNWNRHGATYYWRSMETTYGLNYGNGIDSGRKMTWAEFKRKYPFTGRSSVMRYDYDPKLKWQ